MIDKVEYTLLQNVSSKKVKQFIQTTKLNGYKTVCVSRECVLMCKKSLGDTAKVITVGGFPPYKLRPYVFKNPQLLGFYDREEIQQIKESLEYVDEIDLTLPFSWFVFGKKKRIQWFFRGLKKRFNVKIKVIIELGTIFKNKEVLEEIIEILNNSGVEYVKTNTGLIKQDFPDLCGHLIVLRDIIIEKKLRLKIKASGGISNREQAEFLLTLPVDKIGTSTPLGGTNG